MYEHYPFVNQPLPYAYDALEPYIDSKTMELHHDRHLQTYIDKLNGILKNYPDLQELTLEQLIYNVELFPEDIQIPIKNNAGGVYNHEFYFNIIGKPEGKLPSGSLADAINKYYGSYENFKQLFANLALAVFGSGYTWLVVDKDGKLLTMNTSNQDTPIEKDLCPIINIDVWEHAYYLKHYNNRSDYISDWFNVINWDNALDNYMKCLARTKYMSIVESLGL